MTNLSPPLAPFDVLVVDDEPDVLDLLAEYFRNRGLPVTVATDGRAAVAELARDPSRFGLVVTDLHLPGVDGLAVLEAARRANPSCFVIIITGYASLDSAIQAVRLGAYDYLTKPFSLGQIDIVLERLHDRLALERENRRLLKQIGQRDPAEARTPVLARLDSIDARLARLEAALRELAERRTFPS
ncbi:MAG: response regulator [Acidobacteria bacterium]|nr:response regulator [Acidobacteriota bacterium]